MQQKWCTTSWRYMYAHVLTITLYISITYICFYCVHVQYGAVIIYYNYVHVHVNLKIFFFMYINYYVFVVVTFSFISCIVFSLSPLAYSFFSFLFFPPDNGLKLVMKNYLILWVIRRMQEDAQICGKDDHTCVNEWCVICLYCNYCYWLWSLLL